MNIVLWLAVGLAGIVALALSAMFSRRKALRREFRAYLAQQRPDLMIAQETSGAFVLQTTSGEGRAFCGPRTGQQE
jgi:hypothetical protein